MMRGVRIPWLLALGRGEIVRGESYLAAGRRLTPIARVRAFTAANGRVEFRAVDPIGIVEEVGGSARLIAVGGGWGRRVGLAALVLVPVLGYVVAVAVARAARRSKRARKRR